MKILLLCFSIALSTFAQDYRWIGTNLYNFSGCIGNTNYLVAGRVANFYPHGRGKFDCPVAQMIVGTNNFRAEMPPEMLTAGPSEMLKWLYVSKLPMNINAGPFFSLDPQTREFYLKIKWIGDPVYLVLLNAPITQVGQQISVYAAPNGLQPWHKADGTPIALNTFNCGRPFRANQDTMPSTYYSFTSAGIRKLTNTIPFVPNPKD